MSIADRESSSRNKGQEAATGHDDEAEAAFEDGYASEPKRPSEGNFTVLSTALSSFIYVRTAL